MSSRVSRAKLSAVVFDLDGVIANSLDVMRQAFAVAYREVMGDGPVPFDEYCRHLGRYFPDIMKLMGLPNAMQAPFVRESYRLAHRVSLYDGVVEMLDGLRSHELRLAVATGKSGARARALLKQLSIIDRFEHVIGSDEVAHSKPAPDIVIEAIQRLGVKPAETLMVGDAATDIASARAASVMAVAATWGATEEEELLAVRPDHVVHHPLGLLELCSDLAGRAGTVPSNA
jgi:AHBA synthesis associated protein